jgi:hypothetical protein
MRAVSADRLAWQLAERLNDRISETDRAAMYCSLSCGDTFDALAAVIRLVTDYRVSVTPSVIVELHAWLNGYRGNRDEPRIRALIDALEPTRIRTPQRTAAVDVQTQ